MSVLQLVVVKSFDVNVTCNSGIHFNSILDILVHCVNNYSSGLIFFGERFICVLGTDEITKRKLSIFNLEFSRNFS